MKQSLIAGVLLCVFGVLCSPHAAVAQASFRLLGPVHGLQNSGAYGISADGSTVVGSSWTTSPTSGLLVSESTAWRTDGSATGLGDYVSTPSAYLATAACASADGSVLAGNSAGRPYLWSSGEGFRILPTLPGRSSGLVEAISGDGGVAVGTSYNPAGFDYNNAEACLWFDGGAPQGNLNAGSASLPSVSYSVATGVSSDGETVVGYATGGNAAAPRAFVWTADGGMRLLDPGSTFMSMAYGVSADGSTVIGESQAPDRGRFRWSEAGGFVKLPSVTGGSSGVPHAVSSDGTVIVGNSRSGSMFHACVWVDDGPGRLLADVLRDDYGVNLGDWTLRDATAVSADGLTIVGIAASGSQRRAFVVSLPVPEPGGLAVLASGLASLLAVTRRRQTSRNATGVR